MAHKCSTTNTPKCSTTNVFCAAFVCNATLLRHFRLTRSVGSKDCAWVYVCMCVLVSVCMFVYVCVSVRMHHNTACPTSVSRMDKITCLFCKISSLLQGSFAKETHNFIDPTNRSHPIALEATPQLFPQLEARAHRTLCTATYCSTLQHTTAHCITLQ